MMETNSVLSNRGGAPLSADEIAVLLGFANAAAMVEAIGQYCIAGGTTNAYTATPAIPWTSYSDGDRVTVRIPNFVNTGASTINVSGLGAKNIYKMSQGANVQLTGYELYYGHMATLVYSGLAGGFILESSFSLRAADIPSTLNATTLPRIDLSGGGLLLNTANSSYNYLCGGSTAAQSSGSFIGLFGNSHATKPGDAEYYTGSASGAAHSFFDKNGVEQLKIDENGVNANYITTLSGTTAFTITANASGGLLTLRSSNTENVAAQLLLHSSGHATYPGAHQQFAPLSTRAASTAFAVCPVASGDTARVEVQNNIGTTSNGGCLVFIDHNGTVTLKNPYGDATSLFVNSSSPATGEIGIYLSAGVLYCKPAADYTGGSAIKIATFSRIGKA